MNGRVFLLLIGLLAGMNLIAQQEPEKKAYESKVSGKIFANFNYGLTPESRSTAFSLERAYFGYERQLSDHFFANVKLDVGSPDDISEFSKLRRYAYFKNAGIKYVNGKITVWGGLFDMLQYKIQEKFWGYRYLYKSYMDEYKIGPSADLGAGIQYDISDIFITDMVISNGEGYSSPQRDNTYKIGWGLTSRPINGLTFRTYYAIFTAAVPEMTFTGFAGYDAGHFRLGAEYNYQHNYKFNQDRDRFGYSVYSTYVFSDQFEIFLRYDQLHSNILEETTVPWNLPNDGSALLGGLQYTPLKNLHFTMDYQDWVEFAGNGGKERILYMHMEVNF